MWPFRKKAAPSPAKPEPKDFRNWNEDWKVGDTAECIVDGVNRTWHERVPPWERPAFGARFTVVGFSEGPAIDGSIRYWLKLEGWPCKVTTSSFRKVRPIATEQSEVVSRILNAKPGVDQPRVEALTKPQQLGQEYDLKTPQASQLPVRLRLSETAEDTPRLAASSPVRAESPQKDGVGGARFVFGREG